MRFWSGLYGVSEAGEIGKPYTVGGWFSGRYAFFPHLFYLFLFRCFAVSEGFSPLHFVLMLSGLVLSHAFRTHLSPSHSPHLFLPLVAPNESRLSAHLPSQSPCKSNPIPNPSTPPETTRSQCPRKKKGQLPVRS